MGGNKAFSRTALRHIPRFPRKRLINAMQVEWLQTCLAAALQHAPSCAMMHERHEFSRNTRCKEQSV